MPKKTLTRKNRSVWFTPAKQTTKREVMLKRQGFKAIRRRIIDVGRPGKHYLLVTVFRKGSKILTSGRLVTKRR